MSGSSHFLALPLWREKEREARDEKLTGTREPYPKAEEEGLL